MHVHACMSSCSILGIDTLGIDEVCDLCRGCGGRVGIIPTPRYLSFPLHFVDVLHTPNSIAVKSHNGKWKSTSNIITVVFVPLQVLYPMPSLIPIQLVQQPGTLILILLHVHPIALYSTHPP